MGTQVVLGIRVDLPFGVMAVRLDDLVAEADSLLNVGAFDEGAPSNGLLVRAAGEGVRRIGASVNTSIEAIEAAHSAGVDLLLVHHPSWPHIDLGLQRQKEELLVSYGISLYGAHASLDCATGIGTADALGELLGVATLGRFADYAGGQAGIHGTVDGSFEEFTARLEGAIGTRARAKRHSHAFGHIAIVAGRRCLCHSPNRGTGPAPCPGGARERQVPPECGRPTGQGCRTTPPLRRSAGSRTCVDASGRHARATALGREDFEAR
jgi:putative NIF3 family GTP cyclohydrolase 1 type 2